MIRGKFDGRSFVEEALVVDAELFFEISRVWSWKKLRFVKTFTLQDVGRKLIDWFPKIIAYDVISICSEDVDNTTLIKYVLEEVLLLQYRIIVFPNTESYKIWLSTIKPKMHLCVEKRRSLCKTSHVFQSIEELTNV